jgi:hypothetical protein
LIPASWEINPTGFEMVSVLMLKKLAIVGYFLLFLFSSFAPFTALGASDLTCAKIFETPTSSENSSLARQWHEEWFVNRVNNFYKTEWERFANKYYLPTLREDMQKSRQEAKMLERLGFVVTEDGVKAPTFYDFVKNYIAVLDEKNVPEKDRIIPALTFQKKADDGGKFDYLFVTPDIDLFPDSKDWKIVAPQIKDRSLVRAVANGKLTCFYNGLHDVYHFVSFALHPEGMAAVKQIHQVLTAEPKNRLLWRRAVYMLETLSLGDPVKREELRNFLLFPGVRKEDSLKNKIEDYYAYFRTVDSKMLWEHAVKMRDQFTDFVIPYAGGMADRYERGVYRDQFKMAQYQTFELLMGIQTYFSLESNILPSRSLYESFIYLPDHLDNVMQLMGQSEKSQKLKLDVYNKQIAEREKVTVELRAEDLLRICLARMEFMLWRSASDLTIDHWEHDLSAPNLAPDSPTASFLKSVMGENSIIFRFLSGQI